MIGRQDLGYRSGAVLAVLAALGVGFIALRAIAPTTGSSPTYVEGTSIARVGAGGVDVVMWDGASWDLVVPTGTITTLQLGSETFQPRIEHIVVAPDYRILCVCS